jgi:hypothetical protein
MYDMNKAHFFTSSVFPLSSDYISTMYPWHPSAKKPKICPDVQTPVCEKRMKVPLLTGHGLSRKSNTNTYLKFYMGKGVPFVYRTM